MGLHQPVDQLIELVVQRLLFGVEGNDDGLNIALGEVLGKFSTCPVQPQGLPAVPGDVLADRAELPQPGAQGLPACRGELAGDLSAVVLAHPETLDQRGFDGIHAPGDRSHHRVFRAGFGQPRRVSQSLVQPGPRGPLVVGLGHFPEVTQERVLVSQRPMQPSLNQQIP